MGYPLLKLIQLHLDGFLDSSLLRLQLCVLRIPELLKPQNQVSTTGKKILNTIEYRMILNNTTVNQEMNMFSPITLN